jgi:hypothetical protein
MLTSNMSGGSCAATRLTFWCESNDPNFTAKAADVVASTSPRRFEWHFTPKHGSWLDMAETELGVLSAQCLDRRIPDKQTLTGGIAAWEINRNANHAMARKQS